jgi:uncharacterized membrane protein YgcG
MNFKLLGWGLLLTPWLAGCRHTNCDVRQCDICPGQVTAPAGTTLHAWQEGQHAQARLSELVVYQHEWYQGGDQLGPEGRRHIKQIASELLSCPTSRAIVESKSVVIRYDDDLTERERYQKALEGTDALDETRRAILVGELLTAGVIDAEQRVIVDRAPAEGLFGVEAPNAYRNIQFGGVGTGRNGGMGGGLGGGLGGGFGGGGFGGGGMGGGFF